MGTDWLAAWTSQAGVARVTALFEAAFQQTPEGVWSAPGRVNLIGEHTDYNAGLCLPTALPHRTFVALRRRDDNLVRLVSAQTAEPWERDLAEVAPGKVAGWGAYVAGVAWALREAGHPVRGFEAAVDSCVPFGASLSSSAALECAIAVACSDLFGLDLSQSPAGRVALVAACRRAENDIAGAPTGGLDQSAALLCAVGNALLLDFAPDLPAEAFAKLVPFEVADAGLTVLVVDTRAPHQLVDGQYAARRDACEAACGVLGVANLRELTPDALPEVLVRLDADDPSGLLGRRVRHVVTEIARTTEFADLVAQGLGAGGLPDLARARRAGELMNASHDSLRDDYEVTVPQTDLAVATCRAAGAFGSRMTGGGFGGSIIALVRLAEVQQVAEQVATAFAEAGFDPPAFIGAPPSAAAGRD